MTEPNRQSGENEERIIEIEIERLRPFKEHPFQVKDDKEMFLLQESIEKYGILNPLIVRPVPDGYYEIISGHRRKHAAEKLGYRKVPVIIRVLSEDDSILSMVDSNLHRERIFDVCTRVWGIEIPIKRLTRRYAVAIKWRYGNTWVDLALICTPLYNETLRGCFTVGEKKKYQKIDD